MRYFLHSSSGEWEIFSEMGPNVHIHGMTVICVTVYKGILLQSSYIPQIVLTLFISDHLLEQGWL